MFRHRIRVHKHDRDASNVSGVSDSYEILLQCLKIELLNQNVSLLIFTNHTLMLVLGGVEWPDPLNYLDNKFIDRRGFFNFQVKYVRSRLVADFKTVTESSRDQQTNFIAFTLQ